MIETKAQPKPKKDTGKHMARMTTNRKVDRDALEAEMTAAGVQHRGIGISSTNTPGETLVYTFDAQGMWADLPPQAEAVVAAHVAPPDDSVPDFGAEGDVRAMQRQLAQIVQQLQGYLVLGQNGNPAPTPAQNVGAIKILIRVVLVLIRIVLVRQTPPPQGM